MALAVVQDQEMMACSDYGRDFGKLSAGDLSTLTISNPAPSSISRSVFLCRSRSRSRSISLSVFTRPTQSEIAHDRRNFLPLGVSLTLSLSTSCRLSQHLSRHLLISPWVAYQKQSLALFDKIGHTSASKTESVDEVASIRSRCTCSARTS